MAIARRVGLCLKAGVGIAVAIFWVGDSSVAWAIHANFDLFCNRSVIDISTSTMPAAFTSLDLYDPDILIERSVICNDAELLSLGLQTKGSSPLRLMKLLEHVTWLSDRHKLKWLRELQLKGGISPIMFAAVYGFHEILHILIKSGKEDINYTDNYFGFTALHLAMMYGEPVSVFALLYYGAKTSILDSWGFSALERGVRASQNQSVVAYLKFHNRIANKERKTPHQNDSANPKQFDVGFPKIEPGSEIPRESSSSSYQSTQFGDSDEESPLLGRGGSLDRLLSADDLE